MTSKQTLRLTTTLFIATLAMLLAGCGAATLPPSQTPTATTLPPTDTAAPATPTLPAETLTPSLTPPPPTATLPPTATPTATPDLRPLPEDWRKWPIIPTISHRAIEIYQQGLAMGNDPHHFSKIGDCQMIVVAFFGMYGTPGMYAFPEGEDYLQNTVDWFGHEQFGRESFSTNGGFNAPAVLSSLWADPQHCEPGETPLDCEFRINKPSIVIIGLEFGFKGRTASVYEGYLRQVIDYVIAHGALPVLSTKADNVEGDHSLNLTTARLAYEYDIPLWNFWLAVQPLPAHGMDMERNDGFHISVEGWNMRSYTGLKVLDAILKSVGALPPQ